MANCMPFLSGNSAHFKSVNDTMNGVLLSCFCDASWARSVIQRHTTPAAAKNIFISNPLVFISPGFNNCANLLLHLTKTRSATARTRNDFMKESALGTRTGRGSLHRLVRCFIGASPSNFRASASAEADSPLAFSLHESRTHVHADEANDQTPSLYAC